MYTLGDVPRKGLALYRDRVAMVFEGKALLIEKWRIGSIAWRTHCLIWD
jgi:hypothetical protein